MRGRSELTSACEKDVLALTNWALFCAFFSSSCLNLATGSVVYVRGLRVPCFWTLAIRGPRSSSAHFDAQPARRSGCRRSAAMRRGRAFRCTLGHSAFGSISSSMPASPKWDGALCRAAGCQERRTAVTILACLPGLQPSCRCSLHCLVSLWRTAGPLGGI